MRLIHYNQVSSRLRRSHIRAGLAVVTSLSALAISPAAGTASVTLGQLAPTPTTGFCAPDIDRLQATVTSGTSYVIPGGGTIKSWSTNAGPNASQKMTFKVFRRISGVTYEVVAHDTQPLVASQLNTFTTGMTVRAGDVLGLNQPSGAGQTYCDFPVTGDGYPFFYGNLADSSSGDFNHSQPDDRLNVSAVLSPSHKFSFGGVQLDKMDGTAKVSADIPGPGRLSAKGKDVKVGISGPTVAKTLTGPGKVKLKVKASGAGRKHLNHTGKLKVNLHVTYTPTGGTKHSEAKHLTLKKTG